MATLCAIRKYGLPTSRLWQPHLPKSEKNKKNKNKDIKKKKPLT